MTTPESTLSQLIEKLDEQFTDPKLIATFIANHLVENPPDEASGKISPDGGWVSWPSVARLVVAKFGDFKIYVDAEELAYAIVRNNQARASLRDRLERCEQMATEAIDILRELVNEIYDCEFAEGYQGEYIGRLLDQNVRNMRYALALFDQTTRSD